MCGLLSTAEARQGQSILDTEGQAPSSSWVSQQPLPTELGIWPVSQGEVSCCPRRTIRMDWLTGSGHHLHWGPDRQNHSLLWYWTASSCLPCVPQPLLWGILGLEMSTFLICHFCPKSNILLSHTVNCPSGAQVLKLILFLTVFWCQSVSW